MSFNIDDHTLEERKKVLDENVSLRGIAERIKAGKAKVSVTRALRSSQIVKLCRRKSNI